MPEEEVRKVQKNSLKLLPKNLTLQINQAEQKLNNVVMLFFMP